MYSSYLIVLTVTFTVLGEKGTVTMKKDRRTTGQQEINLQTPTSKLLKTTEQLQVTTSDRQAQTPDIKTQADSDSLAIADIENASKRTSVIGSGAGEKPLETTKPPQENTSEQKLESSEIIVESADKTQASDNGTIVDIENASERTSVIGSGAGEKPLETTKPPQENTSEQKLESSEIIVESADKTQASDNGTIIDIENASERTSAIGSGAGEKPLETTKPLQENTSEQESKRLQVIVESAGNNISTVECEAGGDEVKLQETTKQHQEYTSEQDAETLQVIVESAEKDTSAIESGAGGDRVNPLETTKQLQEYTSEQNAETLAKSVTKTQIDSISEIQIIPDMSVKKQTGKAMNASTKLLKNNGTFDNSTQKILKQLMRKHKIGLSEDQTRYEPVKPFEIKPLSTKYRTGLSEDQTRYEPVKPIEIKPLSTKYRTAQNKPRMTIGALEQNITRMETTSVEPDSTTFDDGQYLLQRGFLD